MTRDRKPRQPRLLDPYAGPAMAVVLATGPALEQEQPATLQAKWDMDEREIRAEVKWTSELARMVRIGSVSIETALDAATAYAAKRALHQCRRADRHYGGG